MYQLRKIPLFRFCIPLFTGVALAIYIPLSVKWLVCSVALLLSVFTAAYFLYKQQYTFRWLPGLLVNGVLFCCGCLTLQTIHKPINTAQQIASSKKQLYWVTISSTPVQKTKTIQLEGVVTSATKQTQPVSALLYLDKKAAQTHLLNIGDKLLVYTHFTLPDAPNNPLQFDYRQYLSYKGIFLQGFIKQHNILRYKPSNTFSLTQQACGVRKWLVQKMGNAGLGNQELAIAAALIIGEEEKLTPELKSAYSATGAMHVLSVSGLHVGIIYLILLWLLNPLQRKLSKNWNWVLPFACIVLLWCYAFVTGLSPSVQRATVMFSIVAAGNVFQRKTSIFNSLAASALLLVLIQPYILTEVGFQLSYLALLGILVLQKPIYNLIHIKHKWVNKAWEITTVSIAAQLTTSVLSALYFHQFPNYFLLSNLVVIPASFVILLVGVAFICLCWIPGIDLLLGQALHWSTFGMNWFLFFTERLPGALWQNIYITTLESWLLYVLLLLFTAAFYFKSKQLVFASLIGVVCFLGEYAYRQQTEKPSAVCFYSLPNAFAISFQGNKNPVLLTNFDQPEKLDFYIGNQLAKLGITQFYTLNNLPKTIASTTLPDGNTLINHQGKLHLIAPNPINPDFYRALKCHSVLILFNKPYNFKTNTFQAENWLIGTNLSRRKQLLWLNYLKNENTVLLADRYREF